MELEIAIKKYAEFFGLDPDLIRAICKKESNYNPWAIRFEPVVYANGNYLITPAAYASRLLISVETEKVMQSCSIGAMQVMGFLARELGYYGELTKLCAPDFGIKYGCTQLKRLFQKYGDEAEVISAYNQGSPRKSPGGQFLNFQYVDAVHTNLIALRKIN